jgi:hypothetical protein
MTIGFPSGEFDDAVAAVCHGVASDEQLRFLNGVLRQQAAARDEYILQLELHSRLASEPELFSMTSHGPRDLSSAEQRFALSQGFAGVHPPRRAGHWMLAGLGALAAGIVFLAVALTASRIWRPAEQAEATSKAVAMLDQAVNAEWDESNEAPQLAGPLEPRRLKL